MKCKNCGKEINDESRFCKFCGATIEKSEDQSVSESFEGKEKEQFSFSNTQSRNDSTQKSRSVPLIIVSIIAAVAIGFAVYYYSSAKNNYSLCLSFEQQISELEAKVGQQSAEIEELTAEVKAYKTNSQYYEEIVSFLQSSKSSNNSTNYYADTNICFVRKGEKTSVSIFCRYAGTVQYDIESGTSAEAEWGDFNYDGICPIYFTGKREGTSLVKFTKEGAKDSFYVLVVVIP